MITVKSCRELRRLLEHFTFEQIGFIRIGEDEYFIKYHKRRRYRADLYAKVNIKNFEAEVYRCNGNGQPESLKGTYNLRHRDEVLFLLTHCLNEVRVEHTVLAECKRDIDYDQASVIPGRLPLRY